jgi:catechol 2,3-dioxygenase-like lactoylglutathione lyase family enzyme
VTGTHTKGVSLRLLVLKTRHLDRAKSFYEALGIQFVEEHHGNGPVHYSGQVGVTTIEVYPGPKTGRFLTRRSVWASRSMIWAGCWSR